MISRVFLPFAFRGWILEGIVKESAKAIHNKITIIYIPNRIIDYLHVLNLFKYLIYKNANQSILVVNQNSFIELLNHKKIAIGEGRIRIFFTHSSNIEEFYDYFNKFSAYVEKILVMNNSSRLKLIELGVSKQKIVTIYGAIDSNVYHPLTKTQVMEYSIDPFVLIVGECKPRKNPRLIYEVIRYMEDTNFILHGSGWKSYLLENSLKIPNNVKIKEFRLADNPTLMRTASTYLSLSNLEGGPYTTLEALASGTPVVATNTGWNSEFINSANGCLIENNFTIPDIASSIREAIRMKSECFSRSLLPNFLSWRSLGQKIYT